MACQRSCGKARSEHLDLWFKNLLCRMWQTTQVFGSAMQNPGFGIVCPTRLIKVRILWKGNTSLQFKHYCFPLSCHACLQISPAMAAPVEGTGRDMGLLIQAAVSPLSQHPLTSFWHHFLFVLLKFQLIYNIHIFVGTTWIISKS